MKQRSLKKIETFSSLLSPMALWLQGRRHPLRLLFLLWRPSWRMRSHDIKIDQSILTRSKYRIIITNSAENCLNKISLKAKCVARSSFEDKASYNFCTGSFAGSRPSFDTRQAPDVRIEFDWFFSYFSFGSIMFHYSVPSRGVFAACVCVSLSSLRSADPLGFVGCICWVGGGSGPRNGFTSRFKHVRGRKILKLPCMKEKSVVTWGSVG